MSITAPPTPPQALSAEAKPDRPRKDTGDRLFRQLCRLAALSILVVSALLVIVLVWKSWQALSTLGLDFLVQMEWKPVDNKFGALPFVWGTVITSAIAMLIAVPLGVGTAAYLSEISTGRFKRIASFFIEMLAAIPSVVYGFWGVTVLAPLLQTLFNNVGGVFVNMGWIKEVPNNGGMGIVAAGLILSIMIVPYIAAISYDVCQAVPRAQREGSLALGATRWQTIWNVVLPYARPGIIGGCFLALGRALGETMAVTMLIGNKPTITVGGKPGLDFSFFALGDSIASRIANQYVEAPDRLFKSVLVELGLLLLVVTVLINILARWLLWRTTRSVQVSPGATTAEPLVLGNGEAPKVRQRHIPIRIGEAPLQGTHTAKTIDRLMTGILGSCVLVTMGILVVILAYLLNRGFSALNWDFFTQLPLPPKRAGGGLANALLGSLQIVGLATLLAVPIGICAAIYLVEFRPGFLGTSVRFIAELLGGVPSIVIGIFAAVSFGVIADLLRGLGWNVSFFGWSGVFALGIMMIPIVLRASEEALKLVPSALRNASTALGATQAQTVLRIILPAALPAIITGVFLSVARIAGETAPLLLTAGFNNFWPDSLGDFTPTLPPYIFKYATSPYKAQQDQAWAAAFVLMVVVLLLNFGIRALTGKRVVQASRAE